MPLHPDALDENEHPENPNGVTELPVEIPETEEYYVTLDGLKYREWNDIPHGTLINYRNRKSSNHKANRERALKLKNSGCFRSDLRVDAFMDLRSIVETTKKHGNSPYNAILALF